MAVAEQDGEIRSLGTIPNREDSIRKFIKKLGLPEQLRAVMKLAHRLCTLLAVGAVGSAVRGGGAFAGSEEARRSRSRPTGGTR